MAKKILLTDNSLYREAKDGFITVNGVYRKIKDGFITVNGVYRPFFSSGLALSELPSGALLKLNVGGSSQNMRIIHQGRPSSAYDSSCNGTWVWAYNLKTVMSFIWQYSSTSNDHKAINGSTFLTKLDSGVQALIKTVKIPYRENNNEALTTLSCKAFLLSHTEVGFTNSGSFFATTGACLSYFKGLTDSANSKRVLKNSSGTAFPWSTRSSGGGGGWRAYASKTGALDSANDHDEDDCLLAPAFILPSDALVNPTPNADGSYTLLA